MTIRTCEIPTLQEYNTMNSVSEQVDFTATILVQVSGKMRKDENFPKLFILDNYSVKMVNNNPPSNSSWPYNSNNPTISFVNSDGRILLVTDFKVASNS